MLCVSGPSAVFIRCTSGNGWLPISTPDGKQQILKHVGKESETNMDDFEIADGKAKLHTKRKVEWYQKSSRGGSGRNSGNRTPITTPVLGYDRARYQSTPKPSKGSSSPRSSGGSPRNQENKTSVMKDMMTK